MAVVFTGLAYSEFGEVFMPIRDWSGILFHRPPHRRSSHVSTAFASGLLLPFSFEVRLFPSQ